MTTRRKIVEIDQKKCNGCGLCITSCAEGAIELLKGKAVLVKDSYCDGLGACLDRCPQGAIRIIEREAEAFDREEAEMNLAHMRVEGPAIPSGCPSTLMEVFNTPGATYIPVSDGKETSALTHWPVQIRLVSASAPFLGSADLLVAADCVPVAFPGFHSRLLDGKKILMGCPKFDDTGEYVDKFAQIFDVAGIRSVTVAVMEVPCCSRLPMIVKQAMSRSGRDIPVEVVVIGTRGEITKREKIAA